MRRPLCRDWGSIRWVACATTFSVAVACSSAADAGNPSTSQGAATDIAYNAVELPGLGGDTTVAADLNQKGDVAGWATDPSGVRHAVVWKGGLLNQLPGVAPSAAGSLNDSGTVVGAAQDPRLARPCLRRVVWTAATAQLMSEGAATSGPGAIPDTATPCATAPLPNTSARLPNTLINNRGSILSLLLTAPELTGTVLYTSGQWSRLPIPPSMRTSYPYALNNLDVVAGSTCNDLGYCSSVSFSGSDVTYYDAGSVSCGTPHSHVGELETFAISDSGWALTIRRCGSLASTSLSHNGPRLTDFGSSAPTSGMIPLAVNNQGTTLLHDTTSHALVLFQPGSTVRRIVVGAGWRFDAPTVGLYQSIRGSSCTYGNRLLNDAGQIVAQAVNTGTGRTVAVLLTPK